MRIVTNSLACAVILAVLAFGVIHGEEYYVDPAGNHVHPYTNLTDAATNIQSALAAASATASATDIVWIAEGVYTATNAVLPAGGTNVLHIDKPIALRALGSVANTLIDGDGTNRCIYVTYDISGPDNVFELNGITVSTIRTRTTVLLPPTALTTSMPTATSRTRRPSSTWTTAICVWQPPRMASTREPTCPGWRAGSTWTVTRGSTPPTASWTWGATS